MKRPQSSCRLFCHFTSAAQTNKKTKWITAVWRPLPQMCRWSWPQWLPGAGHSSLWWFSAGMSTAGTGFCSCVSVWLRPDSDAAWTLSGVVFSPTVSADSYGVPAAPVSSRMHEHPCESHKSRSVADKPLFRPGKAAHTRPALEGGMGHALAVTENDYTHPSSTPEKKRKTDLVLHTSIKEGIRKKENH